MALAAGIDDDGAVGLVVHRDAHAVELGQRLGPQHVGGRARRPRRCPRAAAPGGRCTGRPASGRASPRRRSARARGAAGRRARAPAAGGRCRARSSARRAAGSAPPGRARGRSRAAGARRRSASPSRRPANACEVEAVEHVGRHRPVVAGLGAEVADVRRAAEQHVLERRSCRRASAASCGT